MTLHRLLIFCAIVEKQSFTKAANSLLLGISSVSMQIRSLEESLGVKLFSADKSKSLALTPAGIILYDYASKILRDVDHLKKELSSLQFSRNESRFEIRLAANPAWGTIILPPILVKMKRKFPDIRIILNIAPSNEIISNLEENRADIGLLISLARINSNLKVFHSFQQPLKLVVSPDCPDSLISSGWKNVLNNIPLILPPPDSLARQAIEKFLFKNNVNPIIAMELRQPQPIKQTILAYHAASFLAYFSVRNELANNLLKQVEIRDEGLTLKFVLASINDNEQDFFHELMRYLIRELELALEEENPFGEQKRGLEKRCQNVEMR